VHELRTVADVWRPLGHAAAACARSRKHVGRLRRGQRGPYAQTGSLRRSRGDGPTQPDVGPPVVRDWLCAADPPCRARLASFAAACPASSDGEPGAR
jgi:hypothetical protein